MEKLTGAEVIEILNEWITNMEEDGTTAITLEELDQKVDSITDLTDEDKDSDDCDGCDVIDFSEKLDEVSEKLTLLLEKFE